MTDVKVQTKLAAKKILIVEDNVVLRFVLAEFLRDAGFAVVEASSGDEARSFLNTPNSVSLVFTDVHMPGETDGITLARIVTDALPQVKVVVTSGELSRLKAPKGIPFVPKPYDLPKLQELFKSLLLESTL